MLVFWSEYTKWFHMSEINVTIDVAIQFKLFFSLLLARNELIVTYEVIWQESDYHSGKTSQNSYVPSASSIDLPSPNGKRSYLLNEEEQHWSLKIMWFEIYVKDWFYVWCHQWPQEINLRVLAIKIVNWFSKW